MQGYPTDLAEIAGRSVGWSAGRSDIWSVGRSVGLPGCRDGRSVARSVRLVGRLGGRMAMRPVGHPLELTRQSQPMGADAPQAPNVHLILPCGQPLHRGQSFLTRPWTHGLQTSGAAWGATRLATLGRRVRQIGPKSGGWRRTPGQNRPLVILLFAEKVGIPKINKCSGSRTLGSVVGQAAAPHHACGTDSRLHRPLWGCFRPQGAQNKTASGAPAPPDMAAPNSYVPKRPGPILLRAIGVPGA